MLTRLTVRHHLVPSKENAYRPHLLSRMWLLVFLAVILSTEGFLVANLVARQTNQNFLAAVVPAEIVAFTNTQREQNNLHDLVTNKLLTAAAQAKAEDMASHGYFSHVGPGGKTPWQWISDAGYRYQYAGENLAVRFIDSKDVVNAWMQSPTHRDNIVKPVYTEIGVGVAQGIYDGEMASYVVQYFASPATQTDQTVVPSESSRAVATTSSSTVPVAPRAPLQPQVEGASVAPAAAAQENSMMQNFGRQLTRIFANPQESSAWILGSIATLLLLTLAFTFFTHMQIQPTNMLVGGVVVAGIALIFMFLNSRIVVGGVPSGSQAAGVIESSQPLSPPGVIIDSKAESVGYRIFPQ